MCDNKVLAALIAAAIKANSGKRLTQEQSETLVGKILTSKLAEGCTVPATIAPLLNLSQFNQEMERHGLVKTDRAVPALISAIAEALKNTK